MKFFLLIFSLFFLSFFYFFLGRRVNPPPQEKGRKKEGRKGHEGSTESNRGARREGGAHRFTSAGLDGGDLQMLLPVTDAAGQVSS